MGINCLHVFLKSATKGVHISDFSGQTAAIDGFCWLHRALTASVSRTGKFDSYLEICEAYLRVITRNAVKAFVVFDGLPLPAKSSVREIRARKRDELKKQIEELVKSGKEKETWKLKGQSVSVEYKHIIGLIDLCRRKGIKYVVSPFEADAQLAYLSKNCYADLVITEDSDLLPYGCKKVLCKLEMDGNAQLLDMTTILEHLKLNENQFLSMCIAAGCDYLTNIKTVGINKAKKIVEGPDFLGVLSKHKYAPPNYKHQFLQAVAVFRHQLVFDLHTLTIQPLNPWRNDGDEETFGQQCGKFYDDNFALDFALGNIDPATLEKKERYPLPQSELEFLSEHQKEPSDNSTSPPIVVQVSFVDATWFQWTIPRFPVMKIGLRKATGTVNGKISKLLLHKDAVIEVGRAIMCSAHCAVNHEECEMTVIWQWSYVQEVEEDRWGVSNENTEEEEINRCEQLAHTLPFKVLGVAYCSKSQDLLEKVYKDWQKVKDSVEAKLVPEPSNQYDSNAVAVYISYKGSWTRVGYIAKELTKYIHLALRNNNISDVQIKHIRFRTTFLKIGFYLTLNITKKGEWDSVVVKASKHVQ